MNKAILMAFYIKVLKVERLICDVRGHTSRRAPQYPSAAILPIRQSGMQVHKS